MAPSLSVSVTVEVSGNRPIITAAALGRAGYTRCRRPLIPAATSTPQPLASSPPDKREAVDCSADGVKQVGRDGSADY